MIPTPYMPTLSEEVLAMLERLNAERTQGKWEALPDTPIVHIKDQQDICNVYDLFHSHGGIVSHPDRDFIAKSANLMTSRLAAARREVEARAALAPLLEAKREKDTNGKTRRYEFLRLEGWKRAEEIYATLFPSVASEESK